MRFVDRSLEVCDLVRNILLWSMKIAYEVGPVNSTGLTAFESVRCRSKLHFFSAMDAFSKIPYMKYKVVNL